MWFCRRTQMRIVQLKTCVQNCKSVLHCRIIICQHHHLKLLLILRSRNMSWTVVLNIIAAGDMDRISTVSESVFKTSSNETTGLSPPTGGADLNSHMHNHVSRPTTSEAGVMAKAKKSVEEELELATVVKGSSSKGFRIPSNPSNKVKTNNFFKMMNNKTNVLTSPR